MNYSNIIEITGVVSCIYREKTKQYTELRLAVRTINHMGWETTILCVRRFEKGEKVPLIRKGTWVYIYGTVRLNLSINGKLQAHVLMIDEPEVIRDKDYRVMDNRVVAKGVIHAVNRGNFKEEELEANFLLRARDPQTGFDYEYCCMVPDNTMNDLVELEVLKNPMVVVGGSLMMLYHPDDGESSACCIIADGLGRSLGS